MICDICGQDDAKIRYVTRSYGKGADLPLLLEQLGEFGVDISVGQLNNLLIEEKDRFHQEKDRILAVGLQVSSYINMDDTGARHKGNNGYCTHIGNESFSWFEKNLPQIGHIILAIFKRSNRKYRTYS